VGSDWPGCSRRRGDRRELVGACAARRGLTENATCSIDATHISNAATRVSESAERRSPARFFSSPAMRAIYPRNTAIVGRHPRETREDSRKQPPDHSLLRARGPTERALDLCRRACRSLRSGEPSRLRFRARTNSGSPTTSPMRTATGTIAVNMPQRSFGGRRTGLWFRGLCPGVCFPTAAAKRAVSPLCRARSANGHKLDLRVRPVRAAEVPTFPVRIERAHDVEVRGRPLLQAHDLQGVTAVEKDLDSRPAILPQG
jgi:hypothetical protein